MVTEHVSSGGAPPTDARMASATSVAVFSKVSSTASWTLTMMFISLLSLSRINGSDPRHIVSPIRISGVGRSLPTPQIEARDGKVNRAIDHVELTTVVVRDVDCSDVRNGAAEG